MSFGISSASSRIAVVIVGGGYAGMIASNRFWASLTEQERQRVRVTIVNRSDHFVHRIRLHEHASGGASALLAMRSMIADEVDVVVGTATLIDPDSRTVSVDTKDGVRALAYDRLVYTVGSDTALAAAGRAVQAIGIGDAAGAEAIRRRIADGSVRSLSVVGAGPTGVETVTELAEAHPAIRVSLVAGGTVAEGMRPSARRSIRRVMRRLGIQIIEGSRAVGVTDAGVALENGAVVESDLVVWAAGFDVPDLAALSGLPTDDEGRLLVDETLRSVGAPEILGAGDAVRVPSSVGAHLPMGARVALPMGGHVAETLLADLRGERAEALSIGLLGPSISLGRKRGYIQLARRDDSPTPIALTGSVGAAVKAWVCRMTIETPRRERQVPGAYRVPRGPAKTQ